MKFNFPGFAWLTIASGWGMALVYHRSGRDAPRGHRPADNKKEKLMQLDYWSLAAVLLLGASHPTPTVVGTNSTETSASSALESTCRTAYN